MKILTWDTPNFGDRLNELVWPAYMGDRIDEDPHTLLVGIGSLLNHRLPKNETKWIFGSGVGHGEVPVPDSSWKVQWVRGPRSASALGLHPHSYITDGAILLADMYPESIPKKHEVSFIPHCSAVEAGVLEHLRSLCTEIGLNLISPCQPPLAVISEIKASKKVITEALHGAIVADAFRTPWIPVSRDGVLEFKWLDWAESMGMTYQPVSLPYHPRWWSSNRHPRLSRRMLFPLLKFGSRFLLEKRLSALASGDLWRLSQDGLVQRKITHIKEVLAAPAQNRDTTFAAIST